MLRISKALELSPFVVFHGYDDKDYPAVVTRVSRKVATVVYRCYAGGLNLRPVTAYVSDPARLSARTS